MANGVRVDGLEVVRSDRGYGVFVYCAAVVIADLGRLPRVPEAPPLSWDAARYHLATHATAGTVTLG
jgi:hypothetical protein